MTPTTGDGTLLVLAPSTGFGGGIERVASAAQEAWTGRCVRVDLYRREKVDEPASAPQVKAWFAARAMAAAARTRPSTVLALHVGLLPVAATLATAARARLALYGLGREVWRPMPPMTQRLVGRCDHILAISHFTAQVLARRAGRDPAGITVVYLPVAPRILAAAGTPTPAPDRLPVLLTVSRVVAAHRYKGHFAIAESLPEVIERRPDARWVVVGDGDDLPALRARCEQLGVLHAVSFERRVSDDRLSELYRTASAMVLPSVADAESESPVGEGFGLVYAEAGAFGVPSIASTASGGAAELITDGETGIAVPPHDREALTRAMLRLLDQPAEGDRLGQAMRSLVFARHTSETFGEALTTTLASP